MEVVNKVGMCSQVGLCTQFACVKAHMGVEGNERAAGMVKVGCKESLLHQVMARGVRAKWKHIPSKKRAVSGLGARRIACWDRRAVLRYTQLRVGKGDVRELRRVIGAQKALSRPCRVEEETGAHLVFSCEESYRLWPWDWTLWEQLDDRKKWQYTVEEEGGKLVVRDKVEDVFVTLDRVMVVVG